MEAQEAQPRWQQPQLVPVVELYWRYAKTLLHPASHAWEVMGSLAAVAVLEQSVARTAHRVMQTAARAVAVAVAVVVAVVVVLAEP